MLEKRWIQLICLLAMSFFASLTTGAEVRKFPIEKYSVKNWDIFSGLPSDSVITIFQDSRKYIWIGTFDGLLKFNGREFRTYDATNTPGFKGHSAHILIEDKSSALWIGTENEGLAVQRNGVFETYTTEDGLPSNSIQALAFGPEGALWIGTNQGLCLLRDGIFNHPGGNRAFDGNPVSQLFFHRDNGLIAALGNGGLYIHVDTNPVPVRELSEVKITAMSIDSQGDIWIGTRQGRIYRLSENGLEERVDLYIRGNGIRSIFCGGPSGSVWIAGNAGLFELKNNGNGTVYFLDDEHSALKYIGKTVLEDHEGNIWLGTRSGGAYALIPSPFTNYNEDTGLTNLTINTVAEGSDKTYWIGADDGLYGLRSGEFIENELTELLSGVRIKHVHAEEETLFVSTISSLGLILFDGKTVRFFNKSTGLPSNIVKKTIVDSKGYSWVSTSGGLVRLKENRDPELFNRDSGFVSNEIYDLFEDSSGRMWIATVDEGLVRFNSEYTYSVFTESSGLSGEMVFSVYEDAAGRFWISTAAGMFMMDEEDRVYPISYGNGLPYLYVYNAIPVGDDLWFTSVKGLARANLEEVAACARGGAGSFSIESFGIDDGLLASPNALSWPLVDDAGRIWIPTHRGLSVFHPADERTRAESWPVYIESVRSDEELIEKVSLLPVFEKGIKRLTLRFAALTFAHSEDVYYSYILKGYDTEWSAASDGPSAVYTGVKPGRYVFSVRAFDDGGVKKGEAAIRIIVAPGFLQSVYSKIVGIFIVIVITALIVFVRMRKIRKLNMRLETEIRNRTEELKQAHKQQIELIADISHEIRTPLTIIDYSINSIRSERYGKKVASDHSVFSVVKRNVSRILLILTNMLHLFKLRQHGPEYHPRRIYPQSILQRYYEEFEVIAQKKNISFSFRCSGENAQAIVVDSFLFESVILNVLSNAFKYTPEGGNITLLLDQSREDACVIKIEDTGKGIADDKMEKIFNPYFQEEEPEGIRHQGIGLGLTLVKKAMDRLQGEINFTSSEGSGTLVTLLFPRVPPENDFPPSRTTFSENKELAGLYTSLLVQEPRNENVNNAEEGIPVLILVEDNDDLRTIIENELGREFNIFSFKNGKEAAEGIREVANPDIIVSDIMMPEMNGKELFAYVRSILGMTEIPFLFLTARASFDEGRELLKQGVTDYIYKPFSPEILRYKIRNLIRIRAETINRYKSEIRGQLLDVLDGVHHSAGSVPSVDQFGQRYGLTEREITIVRYVLEGLRDKEIAYELDCAVSTVSNTLSRIYGKTETGGRTALVKKLSGV